MAEIATRRSTPLVPSREGYLHHLRIEAQRQISGGAPVRDVVFNCRGAFPTDVLEALGVELEPNVPLDLAAPPPLRNRWRTADLDLIESEWYFDAESAADISDRAARGGGKLVALGTPTIAALAAGRSEVTLIDSSPWLLEDQFSAIDYRRRRVSEVVFDATEGATFVIDPPWHLHEYSSWLTAIAPALIPGTHVFLVLPQILSLKSSSAIRQFAIEFFSARGSVDVFTSAVKYESPQFERNILGAAGLSPINWRTGDLLQAVVMTDPIDSATYKSPPVPPTEVWRGYEMNGTIVRVRGEYAVDDVSLRFDRPRDLRRHNMVLSSPSHSRLSAEGINIVSSSGVGLALTSGMNLLERTLSRASDLSDVVVELRRALPELSERRSVARTFELLLGLSHEDIRA